MAHDVFISHAVEDKTTADAVCRVLEEQDIRCWYAPRDVPYGTDFEDAIVEAIIGSRVMVLIISAHSIKSRHVKREVQVACAQDAEVPIIPFRIQDVPLNNALTYYLGSVHWLDASTPQLETHLQRLVEHVQARLAQYKQSVAGKEVKDSEYIVAADQPPVELVTQREPPAEDSDNEVTAALEPTEDASRTAQPHMARDNAIAPTEVAGQCQLTKTQKLQLEYWARFREYLRQHGGSLRLCEPQPQYWMYVGSPEWPRVCLVVLMYVRARRVAAGILLSGPQAKEHFHALLREKEAIEADIGMPLDWQERPKKGDSQILVHRENANPQAREEWPAQHAWLCVQLEQLYYVLMPRINDVAQHDHTGTVDIPKGFDTVVGETATDAQQFTPSPSLAVTVSSSPITDTRPAPVRNWTRLSHQFVIACIICLIPLIIFVAFKEYSFMSRANNANSPPSNRGGVNSNVVPTTQDPDLSGAAISFNLGLSPEEYENNKEQYSILAARLGDTIGHGVNDGYLWAKVRGSLAGTHDADISEINVDVNNGVVMLRGTVLSKASLVRAERAVQAVAGVDSIVDYLKIEAP